jgi:hypothetical protein
MRLDRFILTTLACAEIAEHVSAHGIERPIGNGKKRDPRMFSEYDSTMLEDYVFHPRAGDNTLAPVMYKPLKTGSITPKGWLLKQLKLQAQGLSGHLSQFWNDVMNTVWIGGDGDGGLHERTPYWLNGIVPLAYLLKNAGIEEFPAAVGIYAHKHDHHHGHHNHDHDHNHHLERDQHTAAATCTPGLDMKYNDIRQFQATSVQQCHDACFTTNDCVAFVIENCTKADMKCWLKSKEGATVAGTCRCYGKLGPHPPAPAPVPAPTPPPAPVPPAPPVNLLKQVKDYMDHICT